MTWAGKLLLTQKSWYKADYYTLVYEYRATAFNDVVKTQITKAKTPGSKTKT